MFNVTHTLHSPLTTFFHLGLTIWLCPEIQHRELQCRTDSFPKIRLSYHYYPSWSSQPVAYV